MKRILVCVLLFLLSSGILAQTARQGDPIPDPTAFHSPMALETVFAAADRTDPLENPPGRGGRPLG